MTIVYRLEATPEKICPLCDERIFPGKDVDTHKSGVLVHATCLSQALIEMDRMLGIL